MLLSISAVQFAPRLNVLAGIPRDTRCNVVESVKLSDGEVNDDILALDGIWKSHFREFLPGETTEPVNRVPLASLEGYDVRLFPSVWRARGKNLQRISGKPSATLYRTIPV